MTETALPAELSLPPRTAETARARQLSEARTKLMETQFILGQLRTELASNGAAIAVRAYVGAALDAYRSVFFRMERFVKDTPELDTWYRSELVQRGFPWKEKGVWHDGDPLLTALKEQRDVEVHEEGSDLDGSVLSFSMVGSAEPPVVLSRGVWILTKRHGRLSAVDSLMMAILKLADFVRAFEARAAEHIAAEAQRLRTVEDGAE